jgi:hypothetical protein
MAEYLGQPDLSASAKLTGARATSILLQTLHLGGLGSRFHNSRFQRALQGWIDGVKI